MIRTEPTRTPSITPSILVALFATLLLTACASTSGSTNAGGGRSVAVAMNKCRTVVEHDADIKVTTGVRPLPDDQLCADVKKAVGGALERAGFRVAETPDAADLVVTVSVTQRARAQNEGSSFKPVHRGAVVVNLLMAVSANGKDLENVFRDAPLDATDKVATRLTEAADDAIGEVARSETVKNATRTGS